MRHTVSDRRSELDGAWPGWPATDESFEVFRCQRGFHLVVTEVVPVGVGAADEKVYVFQSNDLSH